MSNHPTTPTPATSEEMEDIAAVIACAGDWAHGMEAPATVALEWAAAGFRVGGVNEWLGAQCFDPVAAAALRDKGITARDARERTLSGDGGYDHRIGYKVANGDLTVCDAAAIVGNSLNEDAC